ncbi:hypothetical protein [Litoribrevibacter albus]|uniref:Uncharacterized protein n=1 Tax=Litoribrevibacter albus TaxID=1473156 RepID=A0AA37S5I2_9GAMM|nr:hypothetical protein [Litoribrevibacter albus]GLQ29670.1 hypothetical protein GCM10007876_01480 [Litoribrevibacter albus]
MTPKIPSSSDIQIWKRDAKKLSKRDNIPLKKALEQIAKTKQFDSWNDVLNSERNNNPFNSDNDPELDAFIRSLPDQLINEANKGMFHTRKSYVKTLATNPKDAYKEIVKHFTQKVKDSKKHIEIEIWLQVPSKLISNLDTDNKVESFFGSIYDKFPRITHVVVDFTDRPRRLLDFGDPSDPLTKFLNNEDWQ